MYKYILLTFSIFFFLSKENNFSMIIFLSTLHFEQSHDSMKDFLMDSFYDISYIRRRSNSFHSWISIGQLPFIRSWHSPLERPSNSIYSRTGSPILPPLFFSSYHCMQPWVLGLTRAGKGGFSMTRSPVTLRTETKWNSSRLEKCYFDDSFVLLSVYNLLSLISWVSI